MNIIIYFFCIFFNVGSIKYGYDVSYCVVDEMVWIMDEEFVCEMFVGLNLVVIEWLWEFFIKSKLDEDIYGDFVFVIIVEYIELFLEDMDVWIVLEGYKLFVFDYYDVFFLFVSKINENFVCKVYVMWIFLFLIYEGILRFVVIEVSLF